jgi:hypothetical protein
MDNRPSYVTLLTGVASGFALVVLGYKYYTHYWSYHDTADRPRVERALDTLGLRVGDFNEYERVLLGEVVFPHDGNLVAFDEIGGLDLVKVALREAIIGMLNGDVDV